MLPNAKYYDDYPVNKLPHVYPTIPPSAQMIRSIAKFGNLQPIVLAGKRLVCGRRRIDAARKANMNTLRALVFPEDWADDAILALVENTQRRSNPVNELHQVESLLSRGVSEDSICAETGMTKQKLQKLFLIRDGLIKPLRRALEDKLISIGTAELCAKKSATVQNKLLDILQEEGTLTRKDVLNACKVNKKETVTNLPDDLFGDQVKLDWKDRFRDLIEEAKELIRDNEDVVVLLNQAMQQI